MGQKISENLKTVEIDLPFWEHSHFYLHIYSELCRTRLAHRGKILVLEWRTAYFYGYLCYYQKGQRNLEQCYFGGGRELEIFSCDLQILLQ